MTDRAEMEYLKTIDMDKLHRPDGSNKIDRSNPPRGGSGFYRKTERKKRGSELEEKFARWIKHWNSRIDCQAVRLYPPYNLSAQRYTEKQPADYMIFFPDRRYLLDSKECSEEKFYPSRQPAHQLAAMEKYSRNLLWITGFVVWFRKSDPAGVNLRLIRNFADPATICSGARFDWEKL